MQNNQDDGGGGDKCVNVQNSATIDQLVFRLRSQRLHW